MTHILIVEDDPYSRQVVAHMCAYHGILLDVARTAEEALTMLQAQRYGLVIIDLALPGMDGWSLLQAIRRQQMEKMPCVAITAYHDSRVARDAAEAGFDAYIPKPLSVNFVDQLQQFLPD